MSFLLFRRFLAPLALLSLAVAPAAAQVFPFQIKVQQDENFFSVSNGATFNLNAKAIGRPAVIHVTISYRGFGSAEVVSAPVLIGAPSLTLSAISKAPGTLAPGESFTFDVNYRPTTSTAVSGQVEVIYRETLTSGSGTTTTTSQSSGNIILGVIGTVPEFVVSYLLPADGNSIALTDGGKLVFPPTAVNSSSTAQISVVNRGSGPGKFTGLTVSPTTFQAQGVPLFPVTIGGNQQFNFNVRYTPRVVENSTGSMIISLDEAIVNVNLAGSSISNLLYKVIRGTQTTTIVPEQTITFDDTNPNSTSSISLEVQNSGSNDVTISTITASGAGFQLGDNTPVLPLTLSPNASTTFTVNFTPAQSGQFRGRLRFGNDSFDLLATGLGSRLTFSYLAGSSTVAVAASGSVIFSPLALGSQASIPFTVRNEGPSTATIASIGIQESNSAFSVTGLPATLPATLQPGASLNFTIAFSPVATGFTNATLRVDSQSFTVSGSGTLPGPLPAYRFTGPSGAIDPLLQPTVALALVSPYPVAVNGVLKLNALPVGFSADPAVQFSTGGLTATFTIPANTTQAVFSNGANQIRFQTGSVASTITITPSFTVASTDVTPASPTSLQVSVAAGAPLLTSIQATNRAANGFNVVITGVATSKSLTKLDFTFTSLPPAKIVTTKFTVNIQADAALWFTSAQSQSFGGQFQLTIPFTFTSDHSDPPVTLLDSVGVVATNEIGPSNSLILSLR